MLRKAVCAVVVVAFSVGLAMAAEIRGSITKVSDDGKTITVAQYNKETKSLGEGKEYKVSSDVKVLKGKFNRQEKKVEAGEPLSGGLKAEMFQKIGERGVRATITTDDSGQVTQIVVFQGGKGRKKNQ